MDRYPTLPLMRRAYELRANVSAYDAAYVALAEVLGCELLTADRRLAGAPGKRCAVRVLR
jgi:predicted nucleic acid-binding protein